MSKPLLLRTLRHGAGHRKPSTCILTGLSNPVHNHISAPGARSFSQVSAKNANADHNDDNHDNNANDDSVEQPSRQVSPEHPPPAPETETRRKPPTNQRAIPWYLRKDVKQQDLSPLSAHAKTRQALPQLPANPPPILQDVLVHTSTALGVDDLTLLDLRHLDPPPALGTNLLMLIGTARSVKHLNVAADKLCRWLRREHKLAPSADGLLGRQELKVRLRRKAKRSKLARSVGGVWGQADDDGIVTGWISVDVGIVDDGMQLQQQQQRQSVPDVAAAVAARKQREKEAGFVGFGAEPSGCRLVIQLMTEQKRTDVDLESLWGEALARNDKINGIDGPGARRRPTVGPSVLASRDAGLGRPSDFSSNKSSPLSQFSTRGFTQTRRMSTASVTRDSQTPISIRRIGQPIKIYRPSQGREDTLSSLQNLSNLTPEEQLGQLGSGPHDKTSTPFLRQFHDEYTTAPVMKRPRYMVQLICKAIHARHPGYTKLHLFNAFQELTASTLNINRAQILRVLDAMLVPPTAPPPPPPSATDDPSVRPVLRLPDSDLECLLKIITYMGIRGLHDISDQSLTLTYLYLAICFSAPVRLQRKASLPQSVDTERAYPVSRNELQAVVARQTRLRKILKIAGTRFSREHFLPLLRAQLNQGDAGAFWDMWRHAVFVGIPRTRRCYVFFFEILAERANEKLIREALAVYVPMMGHEETPVSLDGDVAKAVMRCLLVVDPLLPAQAEQGVRSPLVSLWTRCMENVAV